MDFDPQIGPYQFGVGEFTTHFRTYFSGDWDVHWGYDLDFDPWPNGCFWWGEPLIDFLH